VSHPQIATFARLADGGAKPIRKIEGQGSLLSRMMHAIAYNPIRDEIVVPQFMAQAVLTFRGEANGEEAPIRVLQGPLTQFLDVDRLEIDPVHNELFVSQQGTVLVFPLTANGNVAPIRTLKGPEDIRLADAMAVDPVRNLLIVTGSANREPRLFIFNRTDQGNVKPRRAIGGPKSELRTPSGPFTVYPPTGKIVVGQRGGGEGDRGFYSPNSYVAVWSIEDDGDVPPQWKIGGPNGILRQPRGVTLDAKNKTVIVSDKWLNAVLTFEAPEIF